MQSIKIQIGLQNQANKPIFLLKNGNVICGNFTYSGRYKNKFKKYYTDILNHANKKPQNGIIDFSGVSYWDAISIYHNYMVSKWQKVITIKKIESFANETIIKRIIDDIKPEFKHALYQKWIKIFKKSDLNNDLIPKDPWQIL